MAGKGDKPRPINKNTYDQNFDKITWIRNVNDKSIIKSSGGKIKIKY
jgi:hypothetical protein